MRSMVVAIPPSVFASFFTLLGLLGSSALAQAQCFSDSTALFDFLTNERNPNVDTTVILCPNTTFDIGNIEDDEVVDGSMPLIAFPNVQYLCGQEGSSVNNCVLKGGDTQFWNPPGAEIGIVSVRGITFEDASFVSILLQGTGEISFVDCIVRVSMWLDM
jgi:hypothetical protein